MFVNDIKDVSDRDLTKAFRQHAQRVWAGLDQIETLEAEITQNWQRVTNARRELAPIIEEMEKRGLDIA